MATNQTDWYNFNEYDTITTDPSYGAVPPLVQAHTVPNVTVTTGTGLGGGYTIGNGGTSTSTNTIWTTTGTGAGAFRFSPDYSTVGTQIEAGGKMSLRGDKADIDINGKSLLAWMTKVEERLNILTPNTELEKEWDELRRLGERYRRLEKKCKEKAEVWNRLKSIPKPVI